MASSPISALDWPLTNLPLEHTAGHVRCPACDRAREMTLARIVPSLPFKEAAQLWLDSRSIDPSLQPLPHKRARFIKDNSKKAYAENVKNLSLFFGELRLDEIHIGHLRQYQEARIAGNPPFVRKRRPNRNCPVAPCPAGPRKVNAELALLKRILQKSIYIVETTVGPVHVSSWSKEMEEYYEPFQEDVPDVQRALTVEEQQRWLAVASTQQRWWIIYWYSLLAFETSMGTNEMRSLRIGDVNLYHGIVNVPQEGGKNKYRVRTIPLISAEAKWAAEQLLARARDLGASSPMHYLFPFKYKAQKHDPTKPMGDTGLKVRWEEVREAAGLKWFRMYDTRHAAITRWAEQGKDISDIMAMAGHVNRRMTEHYTHISEQAKRQKLVGVAARMAPSEPRTWAAAPFYVGRELQTV